MSMLSSEFANFKVGDILNCNAGGDFVVIAINPQLDRTLLVKINSTYYVGAWGFQYSETSKEWYWSQGHYYHSDLQSAVDYVLDKKDPHSSSCPNSIWLVHTDWTIESGEHRSDAYAYKTHEIAKREFDKLVQEDKDNNYPNYKDEEYTYEEDIDFWSVYKTGEYCENHSDIWIENAIVES